MSTRFRRIFKSLAPSWLTTGQGELVLYSLGLMQDAYAERTRLSAIARFPTYAPSDAVGAMGRDRKMARGRGEAAADYAERMIPWLDLHKVRGTPYALHDQILAYLQCAVPIRTVDASGSWFDTAADGTRSSNIALANWTWDTMSAANWSRFWVIIDSSSGSPWPIDGDGKWGDAGKFGDAGSFGFSATQDEIATLRAIIRDWKPEGTKCEWVIVTFDAALFTPVAPSATFLFENWSTQVAGVQTPARSANARYVKGSL
jgi:hypothetical protein